MLSEYHCIGNTTKDAQPKYNSEGKLLYATINVAINRTYYNNDNEKIEKVTYIPIKCWSKIAENAVKYLGKGSRIFARCNLHSFEYTNNEGVIIRGFEFTAEYIEYLATNEPTNS